MVSSGDRLNVDNSVLSSACGSLSAAADHLLTELRSLDGAVTGMNARWTGSSGGAFRDVWQQWHRGASEVEQGLAVMSQLLGRAAEAYAEHEQAEASELGGVGGV